MKFAVLGFSLSLLLSCASAPFPRAGTAPRGLDEALSLGVDYLADKLPPRAKVAVVSARSPAENLSNYLIDTAVMRLVNKDRFTVIERAELDALQKEQAYQASGEVGDEGAVSLGHQLGAEVIVTGAVMETGGRYSLRLKALDVETARILGTRMYRVENDAALTSLLRPAPGKEQNASQQTVINGSINITNNNTTTINGDVYVNKPDWF